MSVEISKYLFGKHALTEPQHFNQGDMGTHLADTLHTLTSVGRHSQTRDTTMATDPKNNSKGNR